MYNIGNLTVRRRNKDGTVEWEREFAVHWALALVLLMIVSPIQTMRDIMKKGK